MGILKFKMKLVGEYLYEKFTEDGDPIRDLGIGMGPKIEKLAQIYKWHSTPEQKDYVRIKNIAIKAHGNIEKERMYAKMMANAIEYPDKAYRRYKAALYIGGEEWDVTQIFLIRALELNGIK